MFVLILIIVVTAIFIVLRQKKINIISESKKGTNIKSESKVFDHKQYYIEQIRNSNMIKEAEDWFLEAYETEKSGLLSYYLTESIKFGLPYCAVDEEEFEALAKGFYGPTALHGNVSDMWLRALRNDKHEGKANYWRKRFYSEVYKGNYEAIMLVSNRKNIDNFSPDIIKMCDRQAVIGAADNGDAQALLAIAKYGIEYSETMYKEQLTYFQAAAKAGLTDGYYGVVECLRKEFLQETIPNLNEEEKGVAWENFDSRIFEFYKKGAELNNGTTRGICQYMTACYYDPNSDDNSVDCIKNAETALYWYKRAAEYQHYYSYSKIAYSEI